MGKAKWKAYLSPFRGRLYLKGCASNAVKLYFLDFLYQFHFQMFCPIAPQLIHSCQTPVSSFYASEMYLWYLKINFYFSPTDLRIWGVLFLKLAPKAISLRSRGLSPCLCMFSAQLPGILALLSSRCWWFWLHPPLSHQLLIRESNPCDWASKFLDSIYQDLFFTSFSFFYLPFRNSSVQVKSQLDII